MNEVKVNLKKMGWNDNLIDHFVGKNFEAIKTNTESCLKIDYTELHSIVYEKDATCYSNNYIYMSK